MKLGNLDISTVKLGASQVQAIYQGTNLVWQNAPVATAATGIGQTSFTANWEAYTGAVYYLLDVSTSSSFTTFVYENQVTTSTSYVVIGLEPNTTYYYRVRASTEYDADYQAILDYATTQGYTLPSASQQLLQEQLVKDLKTAGIWNKLDTFYVFATDGDSDFASINWIDPNAFELTEVNSPTFTTNVGFTGNGSSAYLQPNYNQGTDGVNWSNPNGSYGVWVDTSATSNSHSYVGYTLSNTTIRRGTAKLINGVNIAVSGDVNNTFIHLNRNSTQAQLFYNGASQGTSSGSFTDALSMTFLSEGGTIGYSNGTISIGFFGGDLSTEQSDFYTAVNTYITSI